MCVQALGDLNQAYQCLRLALSLQNEHAESYNQLAALELHRGNAELARAFLLAATATAPHLLEAHANLAVLSEQVAPLYSHSLEEPPHPLCSAVCASARSRK